MRRNTPRSPPPSIGRDHIDSIPTVIENPVQESSGPMGQNSPGSTSKYRRHQVTFPAQDGMTEGVDALVDPMETADSVAFARYALSEPEFAQLPPGNNPMLPPRQCGNWVVIATPATPTGRFRPA
jgi:hypothetical protein